MRATSAVRFSWAFVEPLEAWIGRPLRSAERYLVLVIDVLIFRKLSSPAREKMSFDLRMSLTVSFEALSRFATRGWNEIFDCPVELPRT